MRQASLELNMTEATTPRGEASGRHNIADMKLCSVLCKDVWPLHIQVLQFQSTCLVFTPGLARIALLQMLSFCYLRHELINHALLIASCPTWLA